MSVNIIENRIFGKDNFLEIAAAKGEYEKCTFKGCDFSGSVFDHCDLERAIFERSILEKADFRTAWRYSIDPTVNRVKKARFSREGLAGLLDKFNIEIE